MRRFPPFQLLSPQVQLLGLALILLAAAGYLSVFEDLPERIPVHWGTTGPDRWGSKHELWVFLGVMLMNVGITWAGAWAISRGKGPDTSGLSADLRLAVRAAVLDQRRVGARMIEWAFLLINVGMAGMWWVAAEAGRTGDVALVNRGVFGLMILMVVAIVAPVAIAVRAGVRNQRRIRELLPSTAEDGWIAGGAIYYAPEDRRLWVAKRIGLGWTLNFARPAAWWALGLLLGLPVVASLVVLAMSH